MKKTQMIKKKLTYCPNDTSEVVWARLHRSSLALASPYVYSTCRTCKRSLVMKKNTNEKKKNFTCCPNDTSEVVWARSPRSSPSLASPYVYSTCRTRKCSLEMKKNTNEKKKPHLLPKRHVGGRLGPSTS